MSRRAGSSAASGAVNVEAARNLLQNQVTCVHPHRQRHACGRWDGWAGHLGQGQVNGPGKRPTSQPPEIPPRLQALLGVPKVDRRLVESFWIEAGAYPGALFLVILVFRVCPRGEDIGVVPRAAAVLRRTGAASIDADRIGCGGRLGRYGHDRSVVQPIVAEVVSVDGLARATYHCTVPIDMRRRRMRSSATSGWSGSTRGWTARTASSATSCAARRR